MKVKVPIVIPQLFYDTIARIIPGAVFLMLVESYRGIFFDPNTSQMVPYNFIESLGRGVELAILAYAVGWILNGLALPSRKPWTKKDMNSKLRMKYQWIRLAHPDSGYRIVKLRAEANMLEALRSGFIASSIAGTILVFMIYGESIKSGNEYIELQVFLTLIGSLISASVIFFGLEKSAWERYKGNIRSVYKILTGPKSPITLHPSTSRPPEKIKQPSEQEQPSTEKS